jgi:hypothetical protein
MEFIGSIYRCCRSDIIQIDPSSEFSHVPLGDSDISRRRRQMTGRCHGSSSWAPLAWYDSVLAGKWL